ncbi:Inactive ubiquitin carboxyl-terminal hydrolase [Melia azedarach]|uniref:Inactive ubiquitin carboxyl-terminal hydrolase n=1 Tax=Melia azedarach TaxID=155640 RepID=A0ACC1X874_MELAZ|nr:Inactive ubiquitin carboxyl-terminal hydrolase [Melia azedarach]
MNDDATDKSEAAGEALLAQISLYAEKNLQKARDQLHQNDGEQSDYQNSEIDICKSNEELKGLIEIEEKQLSDYSEYQKQIENEAKQKCLAEKRPQADIMKAVYLSLDSFEKHYGPLAIDVKDGQTSSLDVYRCVIVQSQFHLRQLRDEYMSRSEIWHIHAGNPCFLCTFRDSFAAMHIALQDLPEDSVSPTFSGMGTETTACEVLKTVLELDHERRIKNEAKQKEDSNNTMRNI